MKFIKGDVSKNKYAIAIGNFDGIHLGHQEVIKTARLKALHFGCKSAVVTFSPHPRSFFRRNNFKEILSIESKVEMMHALSIDEVFIIDFSTELSRQSPDEFIKNLLSIIDIRSITTGYNFRFGSNRKGDIMMLNDMRHRHGFAFNVINQVLVNNTAISSSVLRRAIEIGDVESFYRFTGSYYFIQSLLVEHNFGAIENLKHFSDPLYEIFKALDVKVTSVYNTLYAELLLPPDGLYLCRIENESLRLVSLCHSKLYILDLSDRLVKVQPKTSVDFMRIILKLDEVVDHKEALKAIGESIKNVNPLRV